MIRFCLSIFRLLPVTKIIHLLHQRVNAITEIKNHKEITRKQNFWWLRTALKP
ncbi:hypothetical protein BN133_3210 [Cronobacter dublinensis 582]|nr:hypothetical protein BN133_3210 [Cronobacter dublinensis 582]